MAETTAKGRETSIRERKAKFSADLMEMSDEELLELGARVREVLGGRVRNRLEEFRRLAREAGFELSLTRIGEGRPRAHPQGSSRQGERRGPPKPKYRNPHNPSETWSGRGMEPIWMREEIEKTGKTRDDFLIERLERPEAPEAVTKTPEEGEVSSS
jgi:DNA-binding protein H-NS